jgi:acyl carrier protein
MINQKIKKIISKVLSLPIVKVTDQISPKKETKWDSINNIKILLEVERIFKIKFEEKEFHTAYNFAELKIIIEKKIK